MFTFFATRPGIIGEELQADTWEEAEAVCSERGWTLDGIALDDVVQAASEPTQATA